MKVRLRRDFSVGFVLALLVFPGLATGRSLPATPAAAAATPEVTAPQPVVPSPAPQGEAAATPAPAPAVPRSTYVSDADAAGLRDVIERARRGDVQGAREGLQRIADPLARRVGLWALMDSNGPSLSFAEMDRALRDMAEWPRPSRRRLAAERLIETSGLGPRQITAWFESRPPSTAEGAMALAAALRASGNPVAAADLIRRTWRGAPFERDVQRAMLARFGDVLTTEDHVRRADMLLFGAQGPAARDLIDLLPADQQALAQARIAFRQRSPQALELAAALPPSVSGAPGLAVERAAYYRRADLDELARAELPRFPTEIWSDEMGARIWDERYQLTLSALRNRDSRAAYEAAANTGLKSGTDAVEAEFYAGWIALTRLRDPVRAEAHFKLIDRVGSSPITLARGLYWRGRAVEAMAGIDAADVFYRAAARHRTTFYGQLAAERAGFERLDLGRDPQVGPRERADFEAKETTRAARILYEIGARDLFRVFVLALDDLLDTEAEQAMLVDLVRGYGEQDTSMRVVRTAAQRGFILPDRGYPLRTPPEVPNAPEPALILAIIRQESGFDPLVRSGVGARGMMQLMPATAAATARRLGVGYSPSQLDDPEYNMRLGSTYLGELISSFSGSYVLAVAGYNAGPGRANQWMGFCGDPRAASVDPVDYIECIPFSETRNYVMRVMEAVAVYRAKLRGGLTTLDLGRDIRRGVYTPRPSTTAPATPANAGAGPGQTPEETPP
ncbi:lytic transglycosylase domain-containing protein [Phenylobacterium sp.]|uniref:lytic transglycosylase domain-containing protein n=1 Tax=Phenylobacterium sp. TaxID=1871053 RepID=UPI0025CBC0FB|nr:lytic transglycosylase domain-containing protein [Phenylobacterium sp.]MCA3720489.1 lytic transglycosylase domain-containing protein [Phenylobacterium sp.]